MNGTEDETISKEEMKGLYMFLFAERARHLSDVENIEKSLKVITEKVKLTREERIDLRKKSEKYIKF